MRISTTNIESAGAFVDDIKSLAKRSPALQRLLWQVKGQMTIASKDLTAFSRVTGTQKQEARLLGLWSRVWQSMQSIIAAFRSRVATLVTSLQRDLAPKPAQASHHSHTHPHIHHGAQHQKASQNRHHMQVRSPAKPAAPRNVKRRNASTGFAEIDHLEDALWMVRDMAEGFPDELPPDDLERQLNRWIPWERYSPSQQSLIQEAIHLQLRKAQVRNSKR